MAGLGSDSQRHGAANLRYAEALHSAETLQRAKHGQGEAVTRSGDAPIGGAVAKRSEARLAWHRQSGELFGKGKAGR